MLCYILIFIFFYHYRLFVVLVVIDIQWFLPSFDWWYRPIAINEFQRELLVCRVLLFSFKWSFPFLRPSGGAILFCPPHSVANAIALPAHYSLIRPENLCLISPFGAVGPAKGATFSCTYPKANCEDCVVLSNLATTKCEHGGCQTERCYFFHAIVWFIHFSVSTLWSIAVDAGSVSW